MIYLGQEMKGMRNKYPRSAGTAIQEHIVEDGLSHMSIQSREGILVEVKFT